MKRLNFKYMCETIEASLSNEGIRYTWDTFYRMHVLGFIDWNTWIKFYNKYKDFEVEE